MLVSRLESVFLSEVSSRKDDQHCRKEDRVASEESLGCSGLLVGGKAYLRSQNDPLGLPDLVPVLIPCVPSAKIDHVRGMRRDR